MVECFDKNEVYITNEIQKAISVQEYSEEIHGYQSDYLKEPMEGL